MNKVILVFAAVMAACAVGRVEEKMECAPMECPAMLHVLGSSLAQGDNVIAVGSGTLKLRAVDVATGKIAGGWKADGVSIHMLIIASSASWTEKSFEYNEAEELEDAMALQTVDGSPIEFIDICFHHHLTVEKSAKACYTRQFFWEISVGTPVVGVVELSRGQLYDGPFFYEMSRTSIMKDFKLKGEIVVKNSDPVNKAVVADVQDFFAGQQVPVVCPQPFPFDLAPSSSVVCKYELDVATPAPGSMPACLNEAKALVADGSKVLGSSLAAVGFEWEMCEELDECVFEKEMAGGLLDENCDLTFVPDRDVTVPFDEDDCGTFKIPFGAYLEGMDTGSIFTPNPPTAEITVHIDCPCITGCVLTHGYWKTHTKAGPAPYDDRWMNILPAGEATMFFSSGKTWGEAIASESVSTPAGYYKLAVQYIAAKLNFLAGASVDLNVSGAMLLAEKYFRGEISPPLSDLTALAALLDDYNNGRLGASLPDHCFEVIPK